MIAIVDYGLGNLASVGNAFRKVGAEVVRTSDPTGIREADGVVLPGVGAASAGMERLRARELVHVIRDVTSSGTPLLGLCLGMQLLFEWSEEGDAECLGLLAGRVRRLDGTVKVPHIGWNQVETVPGPLWDGIPPTPYVYFVHSYVCDPADPAVIAGLTSYGDTFCSAVTAGSIWGAQFHPERSGEHGLQLIANFAAACKALAPA
jgi:glutamine amidotransferase